MDVVLFQRKKPMDRVSQIKELAKYRGWSEIDHQENIGMLSFAKEGVRINVYYTKMTVGTALQHPRKGKTQLFRRNVSMKFLGRIFDNPRVHTTLADPFHGYRKREDY